MGTRWSSPMSTSRTSTDLSILRRRRTDSTARKGQSSPIAIRAAGMPNHAIMADARTAPDADRHGDKTLQHAEDARQYDVGGQSADESEPGDVDQSVADADEREEEQRRRLMGKDADQCEGQPPQCDADREPHAQPARSHQE